jgi:hypothetical protein
LALMVEILTLLSLLLCLLLLSLGSRARRE